MTETTVKTVRFAPGDQVPDWLLSIEPMHPGAVHGTPRFMIPTDVLEFEDYYLVRPLPLANYPAVFSFDGAGCTVAARGKKVEVINAKTVIEALDWRYSTGDGTIALTGPPQAPALIQPSEELGGKFSLGNLLMGMFSGAAAMAFLFLVALIIKQHS